MKYGPDDQVERDTPDAPFEQLTEILRARLERGDWRINRAISSENKLADEYGLSRPTVRRALAVLAVEGFVYTVPGRGTFAAKREPTAPADTPD
ncbi:winged helix-turn-helix domain-containing protein [Streptomyces sp. NBC_01288]|uniref:winged helix-turn-helix domain-containing protein n=1 Tax=Streptomyces sp. NBC_01288 TaxID=2903814 RepID=UPI002E117A48|nr:winged helix-turn-helix domain-containing protein [Streptomyces sp. NBC_01288]